jgi:hypothetical protein
LGIWEKPDFVWSDAYNVRFTVYETQNTWGDKRFFFITAKHKQDYNITLAYLNSTILPLLIEIGGITNLGEGAVYTNVYWLKMLRVPTHNLSREKIILRLEKLRKREVLPIFDELGANSPERVSLDKVKSDRRELDIIIMGDILGLSEEEQLEVYRAVVDLVRSSIDKDNNFGKKGKTKEGLDVELLTRTIKEKLGDKLLGNFYRDKILSQKNLKTVKLFHPTKDTKIKNELFGWRVSSGKNHIDCQSETEAENLKIWFESGLEEVRVPKDETHISKILPELKVLKKK